MFIIIFLLIGAFFLISENNIHINNTEEMTKFSSLYLSWLGNLAENAKEISGYVIKLDWLPDSEKIE